MIWHIRMLEKNCGVCERKNVQNSPPPNGQKVTQKKFRPCLNVRLGQDINQIRSQGQELHTNKTH